MACPLKVSLPSGFSMPALGYGTWQAVDDELETALEKALEVGYRHIDTAWVYNNEHVIGKVLKKWLDSGKVKREELFIVTKLPMSGMRPADVPKYMDGSLKKLQLSYVDLYLIHAPIGLKDTPPTSTEVEIDPTTDLIAVWKEMEKQVDGKKTKAIGVSNFNVSQVERILKAARIRPVTNQVEIHAYLQQPELVEFLKKNNVTVTAYSPLGSLGAAKFFNSRGVQTEIPNILQNQVVGKIAKKHKKSPAQVLLRHIIQKGLACIPKSTNPKRIKENIEIFDFELDSNDMKELNGLNKNLRVLVFSKLFKGVGNHPEYPFEV